MKSVFNNDQESHAHSRRTLDALIEYDDFMMSIKTLVDMGCGSGLDLEWWATSTTRDDVPKSLDISCLGVDLKSQLSITTRYRNLQFQSHDFETPIPAKRKRSFDVIWCHDAFQYVINPVQTLTQWHDLLTAGGMLVLILPQTTNMRFNQQEFYQRDGCYFHYTMPSLIHLLAVTGFDCRAGFFLKEINDPWLHAVVYKSDQGPQDPRTATWYHLMEAKLLPESADASVMRHGFLDQRDLILPWVDRAMRSMRDH